MRVVWTETALDTVAEIRNYVAEESGDQTAHRLIVSFFDSTEQLTSFPRSGRILQKLGEPRVREVIVGAYRIIYQLDDSDSPSGVEVLGVVHASQRLENSPVWTLL